MRLLAVMRKAIIGFSAVAVLVVGVVGPIRAVPARDGRVLISGPGFELGSLRSDGTGYRQLVEGDVGEGRWSPDKKLVAYVSLDGEGTDLHLISADGTDGRLLVEGVDRFAWSPTGEEITYIDHGEQLLACEAIWVIDVVSLEKRLVAESPTCEAAEPAWSPKGDEIAFVDGRDRGGTELELDIYSVEVASGEVIRLTDTPGVDRDPAWSPDGAFLVFESSRDHDAAHKGAGGCFWKTEIYRMSRDGSDQKRLSGGPNPDCDPTWSPGADSIAWTTYLKRKGEGGRPPEVRVSDRDGSNTISITDGHNRPSFGADFAPSGGRLVFAILAPPDSDWYFDLYKARPDGSHLSRLTRRGVKAGRPDW